MWKKKKKKKKKEKMKKKKKKSNQFKKILSLNNQEIQHEMKKKYEVDSPSHARVNETVVCEV